MVQVKAEGRLSQLTPLSHSAPYLRTSVEALLPPRAQTPILPLLVAVVIGYLRETYWNASSSGFA